MKKNLLVSFALMLLALSGWAQRNISGTVLDEGGLPLPGATVIEKGTSAMVFRPISMETLPSKWPKMQ